MIMRAKCKIVVYDTNFDYSVGIVYATEIVNVLFLRKNSVEIETEENWRGFITYEQFRNGLEGEQYERY